ncbi:MAG TPA: acylneuraminate cytidylyltransferase family protein [Bacteroidia bacterium]|jgi:N-acylneuraminate cytidylyltransferase/CMP-N,N'-diacetyllegionaminic acid synthase|nr:acylneuraminate cytidylyltransferase family protein [Bacteroidia bacterium]
MSTPKVLFLIPARGGSKGLPKKNIREMNGHPLIHWTIKTALEAAKLIDGTVVVSTDDNEIAGVSMRSGAGIPFMRPSELAQDTSTSMEVVIHALEYFAKQGMKFDYLCMLEATSPQRDADDILSAFTMLSRTEGAESIVGICKTESAHPAFLARMNKNNFITPYEGDSFVFKRRQEIDDVFFFEGSLYISKVPSLLKRKTFYHEKTLGYEMPKWKSFEVDDLVDFLIIERLMKAKENGELE